MRYLFFSFSLLFLAACNPVATTNNNDKTLLFFSHGDSLAVEQHLEKGDFFKYKSADSALRYYNLAGQITTYKLGLITGDSVYSERDAAVLEYLHAKTLLKRGLAFNVRAMYNNAARSLTQCQLLLEKLQQSPQTSIANVATTDLSACYINLGLVHQYLESRDIAGEMIGRAIANKKATADTLNLDSYYIEAANYFMNEAEAVEIGADISYWLNLADHYLEKAEPTVYNHNFYRTPLRFHLAKSRRFFLEKSFELAENHLLNAKELSENLGEDYWKGQVYFGLAQFQLEMALQKQYNKQVLLQKSVENGEKGFEYALQMGDVQLQKKTESYAPESISAAGKYAYVQRIRGEICDNTRYHYGST